MGLVGIFLVAWPEAALRVITHDSSIIEKGAECLRILSFGFIAYGLGMVVVNSLNGAGDTFTPMIINLFCFWILEIPLAYILAINLSMGERGVYYAIVTAETLMTITAILAFRRGKWKIQKV